MINKIDIPEEHWDGIFAPPSCLGIQTTVDELGRVNAAAHATVTRVNHRPVDIAITVSDHSHTWKNIESTGEFVVNVVPFEDTVLRAVRIVGLPFAEGVNELVEAGLNSLPSRVVSAPRIQECRAHYECKVEWTKHWGHRVMIVGRVLAVTMDADCYDERGYIYWDKLAPAQFCGAAYDGNFVPTNSPHFVKLDFDGDQSWRRDLEETAKRSGVNWGTALLNLDYPNVLDSQ